MLFALPSYQFPYTVMNRCFYVKQCGECGQWGVWRQATRPKLSGVGTRHTLFGQTHHALTDKGWDPSEPDTCQRGPHELVPLQAMGLFPTKLCWPSCFRRFRPNRSKINICWVLGPPDHSHRFLCFGSTGGLSGARPTLQGESLVHVGPLMFLFYFLGCLSKLRQVSHWVCAWYCFPQHALFCKISKLVRVDCCCCSYERY